MITAKEARDISLSQALVKIQDEIRSKSSDGKNSIDYYGILSVEDKKTLESLGYTVRFFEFKQLSYRNPYYIISW